MKKEISKQTCESRDETNRKTKIRVSMQWLAHVRTSLHTHNQACVHKQDYAYVGSYPETLKTPKTRQNLKTGILVT